MKCIFEDHPTLESYSYCEEEKKFKINGLFLPRLIGQFNYETEEIKRWLIEVNLSHQAVMDIVNRMFNNLSEKQKAAGVKEFRREDFIP